MKWKQVSWCGESLARTARPEEHYKNGRCHLSSTYNVSCLAA